MRSWNDEETVYRKYVQLNDLKYFVKIIDSKSNILPLFYTNLFKKYWFIKIKIFFKQFTTIYPDYRSMIKDTLIAYQIEKETSKKMINELDCWDGKIVTRKL